MLTCFHRTVLGVGIGLCFLAVGCKRPTQVTDTAPIAEDPDAAVVDADALTNGDDSDADDERPESPPTSDELIYLEQGWSPEQRARFYFLGQGSQLVPYHWFLHLERANSNELFRSDEHLASLGFIPQGPSRRNVDGLPIGFVKASNPTAIVMQMKASELGIDHPPRGENDWLGFTCSACHTADLTYNGRVLRIDGGAAMADVESFLGSLAASMRDTADNDAKFTAFVDRIRAATSAGAAPSREEFESFTTGMERLVARNKSAHPYGLARLDAFGAILNEITAVALEIPENRRPASAPVSYPFLWDTPHMDWVQWNSSAEIPIGRNVGEVLGVFGHLALTEDFEAGYASSARLDYLHELEVLLRSLKAPPWPAEHLGAAGRLDDQKVAAGRQLFEENCGRCHPSRGADGSFAMTPPNALGKQFIKTTPIPFAKVGTDPQMVINFVARTAKPGVLKAAVAQRMAALKESGGLERIRQLRQRLGMPPPNFEEEVPAGILLKAAARGVTKRYLAEAFRNRTPGERLAILTDLRGGRPPGQDNDPPHGGGAYRARPLNGVWATAPFLHNGSVPNLWELLKPAQQRAADFYVGSRELDPVHLGLRSDAVPGAFHFRTVAEDGAGIPGNSNAGHSGKYQTTGADGAEFTEEERWAIIEYIKTLQ